MTHESLYEPCGHCGKRTSRDTDHCWHCQTLMQRNPPRQVRGWYVGAAVIALLMAVGWAQPSKEPAKLHTRPLPSEHLRPL